MAKKQGKLKKPSGLYRAVARVQRMVHPPRQMSEMLKEMLEQLLRDPDTSSDEASHFALFLANMAWNECVGMGSERESYRSVWSVFEAENPNLWDELKSRDIDAMIDELVEYKKTHYPDDQRRILTCGCTPHGTIRVEWLAAAAPGVDSRAEMQLFGLVRTGNESEAVRHLRKTRKMSKSDAELEVAQIRRRLGAVPPLSQPDDE